MINWRKPKAEEGSPISNTLDALADPTEVNFTYSRHLASQQG